ncbi:hypothetical protein BN128_3982 [Cronobacter sakazakii 696]|nr:hypothetical protein BN128_3982 [Cronobacter sakazakii 696]
MIDKIPELSKHRWHQNKQAREIQLKDKSTGHLAQRKISLRQTDNK